MAETRRADLHHHLVVLGIVEVELFDRQWLRFLIRDIGTHFVEDGGSYFHWQLPGSSSAKEKRYPTPEISYSGMRAVRPTGSARLLQPTPSEVRRMPSGSHSPCPSMRPHSLRELGRPSCEPLRLWPPFAPWPSYSRREPSRPFAQDVPDSPSLAPSRRRSEPSIGLRSSASSCRFSFSHSTGHAISGTRPRNSSTSTRVFST